MDRHVEDGVFETAFPLPAAAAATSAGSYLNAVAGREGRAEAASPPRTGVAGHVRQLMADKRIAARSYTREHGEDAMFARQPGPNRRRSNKCRRR
jgi:hypothetical protein